MPRYWNDVNFDAVERFARVAQEHGKTPAQLAIAWLIHNPVITAPIVGASKVSQIQETLKAADMPLSEEEIEACNQVQGFSPPDPRAVRP
mgnify:FL=1